MMPSAEGTNSEMAGAIVYCYHVPYPDAMLSLACRTFLPGLSKQGIVGSLLKCPCADDDAFRNSRC